MLELEHRFRVVDVHARLDADLDGTVRRPVISPENLEREIRQAGIVRTIVFPGPRDDGYLRANNAVARHAVDRPFVALARINGPRESGETPLAALRNVAAKPGDGHVTADDVERYAVDERFHGFEIAPGVDGLPTEAVFEALDDAGLPILVRVGDEFPPSALEATFLDLDLPVVASHFGGYPLNREHMLETLDLLDRHDQCFVETSVVRFRDVMEQAMREHPDRVLFGSGTPDVHPSVGVMEVLTLDVPEDAMRRTFEKNPSRVFPALEG